MSPFSLGVLGSARVAVVSGWTPADLASLIAWYDADDASTFTYSSGSSVSEWRDKSGNAGHLAQANTDRQPSRTGTINSRPAVLFNGGLTIMKSAMLPASPAVSSILAVARNTATATQRTLVTPQNNTFGEGRIYRPTEDTINIYKGTVLSSGVSWGTTNAHSITAVFDGASSKVAVDSGTWTTGNAGTIATGDTLTVGGLAFNYPTELWQGEVCEIVYVTGAVSDATRDAWFDYSSTKWGTP